MTRRSDAPCGYVLEDQVGFLLRKAQQRATEHFNGVMGEYGVTPTQFAAMVKLDDLGPQSQNQLGRLTAMDPATIASVVGRLTRRGWIRLTSSAEDARMVIVALTEDGAAAATAMRAVAAEVSVRTLAPLSPQEARRFLGLVARLG